MSSNSLSLYQSDLILKNQNIPFRNVYHKHIYKSASGKYVISKSIKGKNTYFGSYESLDEAMRMRDQLVENGWDKSIVQGKMDYQRNVKAYYKRISLQSNRYRANNSRDEYCGAVGSIEEALYYRDIVLKNNGKAKSPKCYDLKTDNPYLKNGLQYPLPERLVKKEHNSTYGLGEIRKKGDQSYHLYHGDYVCACRTYEQAYYVKQEMNKCNWDKSELERIFDEYPVWYTWLLNFYKYVIHDKGKWLVNIPMKKSEDNKINRIIFNRVEDALWERDLLVKYDWNEELVVECANDEDNPYYDMELPPYPQRKIRNIKSYEDRTEMFNRMSMLILCEANQKEIAEELGITDTTLRGILKREFDISFKDFKNIVLGGEDPNEVLEQKKLIYTPDLSVHRDTTNIAYMKKLKSPYTISHWWNGRNHYYGSYPTRELAEKIVKDLEKCKWDKSQLERIQAKHGHVPMPNSKRWVYTNKRKSKRTGEVKVYSYSIRKKDKTRKMHNYGTYKDKRVAELVRDLLIECDWNKDELENIQEQAYTCIGLVDNCWRCKV